MIPDDWLFLLRLYFIGALGSAAVGSMISGYKNSDDRLGIFLAALVWPWSTYCMIFWAIGIACNRSIPWRRR